jgi:hypothetical protein
MVKIAFVWIGSQHRADHRSSLAASSLQEVAMLALTKLRRLSQQDFALLGRTEMAYVKRVAGDDGGDYAVHAADGTYISRFADRELACAALRLHDLEPLSLH